MQPARDGHMCKPSMGTESSKLLLRDGKRSPGVAPFHHRAHVSHLIALKWMDDWWVGYRGTINTLSFPTEGSEVVIECRTGELHGHGAAERCAK